MALCLNVMLLICASFKKKKLFSLLAAVKSCCVLMRK